MGLDLNAYWAKNGKIIKLKSTIHINDIIDNPSIFGLTKEYIEQVHKKYNEALRTEGKARAEIMCKVMDSGWIRIRKQSNKQGNVWTLQFDNYDKRKKSLQDAVSYFLLDTEEMKKGDIVHLLSYDGKTDTKYDSFIGKPIMKFLEEHKKEKIELITEYSYFNY